MALQKNLPFLNVRLRRLELQNFRGFRSATLELAEEKAVTVLIADNGGGKSTLLDAAAAFLRLFCRLAIRRKKEDEEDLLSERDILNGVNTAALSAVFKVTYPHPPKEVLEACDACARYLNETGEAGERATLIREHQENGGSTLVLKVSEMGESRFIYLSEDLSNSFERLLENRSNDQTELTVALHDGKEWVPNLSLTAQESAILEEKSGSLELTLELNRYKEKTVKLPSLPERPKNYPDLVKAWEEKKVFIEDLAAYTGAYNAYNPLDESPVVLPLLVYYGGAAINIKHYKELKVPYRPGYFQAYAQALEPERFDFEEFLCWALWANEKQKHAWDLAKRTILNIMNADPELAPYEDIRIETQTVFFDKKIGADLMPIEVAQLSAGEKNVVALVADLVKRAVQLNAVLFNADSDELPGNESNPLKKTPGIVLIDEIDLHLHPRWQRIIVPKLVEHFPEIQFIITTHSPFVLQAIKPEYTQIVRLKDFYINSSYENVYHYGVKIEDIIKNLQSISEARIPEIQKKIEDVYELIDKGNLEEAWERMKELSHFLSNSDDDIVKMETLIKFYDYDVDKEEE